MALAKDDVRSWVTRCEERAQEMSGEPDLQRRLQRVKADFAGLLAAPFIDENRYERLIGDVFGVFIEQQARGFDRAKRRKTDRVALDIDESVIAYSERDRRSGEADLFHERDTQQVEEAYLFIRYADNQGAVRTIWIEVGNREGESTASIAPFQVAAILRRYSEAGRIIEASLYHYHPGLAEEEGRTSRISVMDLMAAANIYRALGTNVNTPLDFRVINADGIYIFYGATLERLRSMEQIDLFRVNALSGRALIKLLGRFGIGCEFEPRVQARSDTHASQSSSPRQPR